MFNPIPYLQQLHGQLNLLKDKYKFVKVSGLNALEGILENSRREKYFFAVDDSQDGTTFRNGGYFERRPYTVFILGKADYGNMEQRAAVLEEAKTIYHHIMSRLIKDKNSIQVLDLERVRFYEVPPAFATGCSGLYFIFNVENPVNLVFDAEAWTME
ncbi:hypothetical protein [Mangrovibacterium sp.]|uniref:hypothetical protein n=1 Tax=Mangrovibacterium sp. TaxID=1961364 RepID=UPI00356A9C4B